MGVETISSTENRIKLSLAGLIIIGFNFYWLYVFEYTWNILTYESWVMLVVGLVLVFPSTSNKKAGRPAYNAEELASYAKAKRLKVQHGKSNLRFEYDPSQEAAQRRSAVAQAILCPSCGVALGIPDVRPIKVTCPQCLQETDFNAR